jgi:hypothetical protein
MTFEEFGTEHEKTMMLLPGTCCDWQINFRNVPAKLLSMLVVPLLTSATKGEN